MHVCNETVFKKLGLLSVLLSRECNGISGTARLLLNSGKIAFETCACKKCFSLMCNQFALGDVRMQKKVFLQMKIFKKVLL